MQCVVLNCAYLSFDAFLEHLHSHLKLILQHFVIYAHIFCYSFMRIVIRAQFVSIEQIVVNFESSNPPNHVDLALFWYSYFPIPILSQCWEVARYQIMSAHHPTVKFLTDGYFNILKRKFVRLGISHEEIVDSETASTHILSYDILPLVT